MDKLLLWIYAANGSLLLVHEMDSAYWEEWKLFRLPGGLPGFLAVHLPLVALVILGAVWLERGSTAGLVMALISAGGGLFAFCAHHYFLSRGRPEFDAPASRALLAALLPVSAAEAVLAVSLLAA